LRIHNTEAQRQKGSSEKSKDGSHQLHTIQTTFETVTLLALLLSLSRFPFNVKIGSAADIHPNMENKLFQDAKRCIHPSRIEQNHANRMRHPSKVIL
jgi:hypothetical protein